MADLKTLIDPDEVRGLIDASLTERDLSPTHITRKSFVNPAVDEVLRRDPGAEGRDGAALEHITTALNCLVAMAVLPTVPNLTKEDFGDGGGYTRVAIDVAARANDLRAQASDEIALAIGTTPPQPATTIPTYFSTLKARRH